MGTHAFRPCLQGQWLKCNSVHVTARERGSLFQGWLMLPQALASHPAELGRPKETDTLESERQRKEVKAF